MQLLTTTKWLHPLQVAAQVSYEEDSWALLYSGMQTAHTGRYSYLALQKQEVIIGGFNEFEQNLSSTNKALQNAWFGYFGYGLKNELEKLSKDSPSFIETPDLWFARFGTIIIFNHEKQHVEVWGENAASSLSIWDKILANIANTPNISHPAHLTLESNMSRAEYMEKFHYIKEAIKRGDIYQANLTRKFFGTTQTQLQPFDIFRNLCEISPAPYSAFFKCNDFYVVSSSPERFLHIDNNGNANTRPIKGSSARCPDPTGDKFARKALASSEKDRAENLMIVDLSRNDLARNCKPGSIHVDELFGIETYATVHHMVSSVSGIKNDGASTLDLIKGCFPPGSMTGTPKIKAMEICSGLEKINRGIYSGAIGWMGGDGSSDLAVVIRTIILQGNKFEFQVGGAIVNDSEEISEFNETLTKARGVAGALGLAIEKLESL